MKTIGKYQVADEIGRSPAGVTCRVRDPFRNREFALKILSPLAALSAGAKDQLYRDLATSWELSHRHIAKVHDVGELEGGVYIATELLVGSSLSHFLATQTLGIGEKLGLLAQVCEALACAHSQGVAHGNIKPGNIFVTDSRNAAILDFGTGTWQTLLLSSGVRLNGMLNYLAPEQILGQPFDGRSDIFSVGLILYEALRGQYPFQAPPGLIPREIVHSEPKPLRKWNSQIPAELEEIVIRALKKEPKGRFQTADELAANLYVLAQHLRREPPAPRNEAPALEALPSPPAPPPPPVESQPAALLSQGVPVVPAPVESTPVEASPVEAIAPIPIPTPTPLPEPEPAFAETAFAPPPVTTAPASVQASAPPAPVPPAPPPAPVPPMTVAQAAAAGPPTRVSGTALWQPPSATPPAKPKKSGNRRLVTFAIGAVMALSMVGVIVVRQNLGAPSAGRQGTAQAATTTDPAAATAPLPSSEATAPDHAKLAPVQAAPAHVVAPTAARVAEPATAEPAQQFDAEQVLRVQVKPLWEAGQYAQAMRLVDEVLIQSPANAEARAWKKRIRAAQDAEAGMK